MFNVFVFDVSDWPEKIGGQKVLSFYFFSVILGCSTMKADKTL
jgi:hypothetical protein